MTLKTEHSVVIDADGFIEDGLSAEEKLLADAYASLGFSNPRKASELAYPGRQLHQTHHALRILKRPHVRQYLAMLQRTQ